MSNITIKQQKYDNTYDEVPYFSAAFFETAFFNLEAVANLFGLAAKPHKTARVLELGCSDGGNIISLAARYPEAQFVGVDYSKVQIDQGNKIKEAIGLKNIELHCASILDIDDSYGKFDYIITHGVFSWVSEVVADKILEISSKNLNENGVVYISYNVYPGWGMPSVIREMMKYHSSSFENKVEKANQARAIINFCIDILEDSKQPYVELLKKEAQLLSRAQDNYLLHEHLEEYNNPMYFHQFIEKAAKHSLQYLADAHLSTMYLGNLPQKAIKQLSILNDLVRTEQYMDFITCRRFRNSLLCHSSVKLNRNIDPADIKKFNIFSTYVGENPIEDIDINNSVAVVRFVDAYNNNNFLSTSSPVMKALFYSLEEKSPNPLSFNHVFDLVCKKLSEMKKDEVLKEMLDNLIALVFKGILKITHAETCEEYDLLKPKLNNVAKKILDINPYVSSVPSTINTAYVVSDVFRLSYKYFDGNHTVDDISNYLLDEFKKGTFSLRIGDNKIEKDDLELATTEINKYISNLIHSLHKSSMLESKEIKDLSNMSKSKSIKS